MNLKQCAHDYFLHKDCNCAEAVVMAANDTWGLGIIPRMCTCCPVLAVRRAAAHVRRAGRGVAIIGAWR